MSEVPLYISGGAQLCDSGHRRGVVGAAPPIGPYSRTMPRALWNPWGGALFLMSEVPP